MSTDQYDFEHFPRQALTFRFSRRQLFANFKIQWAVAEGEERGGKGYKLSLLGMLPDRQLALIIPMIVPDCHISVSDGFVWGKLPDPAQRLKLFPHKDTPLCVFNLINGRTPLEHIATCLQQQVAWERERSFAYVRGFFLHLVQLRVCVPQLEHEAT